MAKAEFVSANGITIHLEGNPSEVAELIKQLNGSPKNLDKKTPSARRRQKSASKDTPTNLIGNLADEGFFKPPKGIAEVKQALETAGHYYPVTSLSPPLLRMVKSKQLRRIKEDGKWVYTR